MLGCYSNFYKYEHEALYKQSRVGPVVQRLERMPYKRVTKFRLLPGPPFLLYTYNGCMAEWFKAPVLKTGIEKSI